MDNFAQDGIFFHIGVFPEPCIQRFIPVVPHHEITAFRHMIGPEIAFCDFFDIRFILHLAIDQHVTVFDFHGIAANANDTFDI